MKLIANISHPAKADNSLTLAIIFHSLKNTIDTDSLPGSCFSLNKYVKLNF